MIDLSILIVNWNTKDYLKKCLQSILDTAKDISYEIIVVDNASGDGSVDMVEREYRMVSVIRNHANFGYAKANNQGLQYCNGRNILLLNPDIIVHPFALKQMIEFLDSHDEVGAVSGKFLNPDGTLQYAHKRFPTIWAMATHRTFLRYLLGENRAIRYYTMKDNLFDEIMSIEQPPTACLMLKKSLIDKIGLFDEQFSLYFNDVDLCKRIYLYKKKIFFLPTAEFTHEVGAASKQLVPDLEKFAYFVGCQRYFRKYCSFIEDLFLKIIFSVTYILGIGSITAGLLLGKRKKEELQYRFNCFLKFLMNKSFS